jgi:hypothetical protein
MDLLNSKRLTTHDGYLHPFREAGTFTYAALLSDLEARTAAGTIVVSAECNPAGKGAQHEVIFHWDAQQRRYLPREEDLHKQIKANDFVVFQFDAAVPGQPPCFVLIETGGEAAADSRRLRRHEAFSHFFLKAGDYAWRIGKASHHLRVVDHRELSAEDATRRWGTPLLIMVNGETKGPRKDEIAAGQSVIWAVESGENVSIEA